MFKKILVSTDGSDLSNKAVDGAIEYARMTGARLVGLTVVEPYPFAPFGEAPVMVAHNLAEYVEQVAHDIVSRFNEAARAAGVDHEGVVMNGAAPWSSIVDAAKSHGCDAIFMASHGRKGLNALFLGSETQKVLVHSTLPVLVYR